MILQANVHSTCYDLKNAHLLITTLLLFITPIRCKVLTQEFDMHHGSFTHYTTTRDTHTHTHTLHKGIIPNSFHLLQLTFQLGVLMTLQIIHTFKQHMLAQCFATHSHRRKLLCELNANKHNPPLCSALLALVIDLRPTQSAQCKSLTILKNRNNKVPILISVLIPNDTKQHQSVLT